jgi:FkbH-like protein
MLLDDRVIAICGTFTAEAIQPGLAFWAGELGLDCEIRFAGYNQLFQQLLDPAGLFARNRRGYNIALIRFEDWQNAGIEEEARRLVEGARQAARESSAPLIVVLCPPTPRYAGAYTHAENVVREGVHDLAGVHVLTASEIQSLYPAGEVHDPHGDELGHVPYTPIFFVSLATAIARKIHAISAAPYKVVALDCDDTLWSGICGEDGPQGVVIDGPRRALQAFMAERRREGMLLVLASKNNHEDVVETFMAHPDMPLRLSDFAAARVNWAPKAASLASLASELDLGLDSFILVDDNPKECTEAQAGAPEVLALPLPAEPTAIPEFLRHIWAFDRARVTEEDRRRADSYAERAERAQAERSAGNLEAFLASLGLEVTIAPMEPAQVARVAQLTVRTNQMNATLVRRSEIEVQSLADTECLAVEVKDRFGSYGLTGAVLFRAAADALRVDTFVLSCRVLGRGVEHRMVARLGEIASARRLSAVEIPFVAGPRNRPAALFLDSLAAPDHANIYRLTAAAAAAVQYHPGQPAARPASEESVSQPAIQRKPIDYVRIATDLRDPAIVFERIHTAARRSEPAPAALPDPPRTPLERELTELWAALLNVPSVGVHENFFELGGHSLLAVQLLSRVRQIHGVELSLEVVYSGDFTVAELAKAVELKEIEMAGADYQDLLREIEGLSDDEVRALLAEEDAV